MITYQNRRGETKQVAITTHAINKFVQRYHNCIDWLGEKGASSYNGLVFGNKTRQLFMENPRAALVFIYKNGNPKRVSIDVMGGKSGRHLRRREDRYGSTVRMRVRPFDFVISDGVLATIEICVDDMRLLNNMKPKKQLAANLAPANISAAQNRLNRLDKKMKTRRWIESEIVYELYDGITTRHQCECGRDSCRATYCVKCWQEILELLQ